MKGDRGHKGRLRPPNKKVAGSLRFAHYAEHGSPGARRASNLKTLGDMAPSMGRRNMTKRECSETSEPSALAEAAIQEICARLNLGLPAGTPIAVNGGLLHRMWRLETSTGVYAVKDLNPEIIAHPGVPEVYRVSERIVRSVAAAGVRAVPALQQQGDPLLTLSDRSVLVFPWFEGTSVPEDAVTPGEGRRIGEVLARLHDLHIDPKGLERPDDSAPPDESWRDLFARGATLEQVWARDPEARLRELTSWTRRSKEGADELDSNLVVSHRDLDQKNVMWDSQGEPCLIDWESAGLISPNVELFEVALYLERATDRPAKPGRIPSRTSELSVDSAGGPDPAACRDGPLSRRVAQLASLQRRAVVRRHRCGHRGAGARCKRSHDDAWDVATACGWDRHLGELDLAATFP